MTRTATIRANKLGPSVVQEVRAIRAAIDKEVGGDIHKLAERARRAGEDFRSLQQTKKSPKRRAS